MPLRKDTPMYSHSEDAVAIPMAQSTSELTRSTEQSTRSSCDTPCHLQNLDHGHAMAACQSIFHVRHAIRQYCSHGTIVHKDNADPTGAKRLD